MSKDQDFKISAAMGASNVTSLLIGAVTPTSINGEYDTLPGNQPNTYGNCVFIWQNQNQIPYNQQPLDNYAIAGNTQNGSFSFGDLEVQTKSYIVGFAVGPNVSQICSTAFVPAAGSSWQYFQTTLGVDYIGTDSLSVSYGTPTGNAPQTNQNWVGLWQGAAPSYTTAPVAKVNIDNNNATGQAVINNYKFLRSTTYTIAYFMGSKQTMMAATYTFST